MPCWNFSWRWKQQWRRQEPARQWLWGHRELRQNGRMRLRGNVKWRPGLSYGKLSLTASNFYSKQCMMCFQACQICTYEALQSHQHAHNVASEEPWSTSSVSVQRHLERDGINGGMIRPWRPTLTPSAEDLNGQSQACHPRRPLPCSEPESSQIPARERLQAWPQQVTGSYWWNPLGKLCCWSWQSQGKITCNKPLKGSTPSTWLSISVGMSR